ncbi:MAG TPA: chemotaxis protein CheW [Gallionellaceae bacterium]
MEQSAYLTEPDSAAETATAENTASATQAAACVVEYAHARHAALPPHTTYALLEYPEFVAVPGAARYAYGLLTWQGARVPLLNLNALLHADADAARAAPRYALILAYQSAARGPLGFGAIGLATLPRTLAVDDAALCALPDDSCLWPQLALSCFQHEGYAVPILSTARLFAAYHGHA